MGVYYTCDECGETAKGCWPCDCPEKKTARNIQKRVGCTIVSAFQIYNGINWYLYEQLQNRVGLTLYMCTCLGGGSGEYEDHHRIVQLNEESFAEKEKEYNLTNPDQPIEKFNKKAAKKRRHRQNRKLRQKAEEKNDMLAFLAEVRDRSSCQAKIREDIPCTRAIAQQSEGGFCQIHRGH